ncbi:hypothetical protein Ddc_18766 [Ditylenchus destructor]|nr:hypothetical protein Ddc_18766 [Ditylenchus destructor]
MLLIWISYILASIALRHSLPITKQSQPGAANNNNFESQPTSGGPPRPPPGFVPTVIKILLDQDESLTNAIPKAATPIRHVDPEAAYKLLSGNSKRSNKRERKHGKNVVNELEQVRNLLAKTSQKVNKKNKEHGDGGKVVIKEEQRKQSRMRAAEIKALLKNTKGNAQSLVSNPERNEELSEYLYEGDIVLSVEQAQKLVNNVAEIDENPTTPEHNTYPQSPGPNKSAKRGAMNL